MPEVPANKGRINIEDSDNCSDSGSLLNDSKGANSGSNRDKSVDFTKAGKS
jgi:hypothetical protein